jgi:hypothetical protein
MDGGMNHHGSSDRHDCLDGTLAYSVVMMGTDSSETDRLVELVEMVTEGLRGESGLHCRLDICCWNHSDIAAMVLEPFLRSESLVAIEILLHLDPNRSS